MSSKPRKRSRPAPDDAVPDGSVPDENRADCPFIVNVVSEPERSDKDGGPKSKKRKQDKSAEDSNKKVLTQNAVFHPEGKFKTGQSMKLFYNVDPRKQWLDMTRYNSFVREYNPSFP